MIQGNSIKLNKQNKQTKNTNNTKARENTWETNAQQYSHSYVPLSGPLVFCTQAVIIATNQPFLKGVSLGMDRKPSTATEFLC